MEEETIWAVLGDGRLSPERRKDHWSYDHMFKYYPEKRIAVDYLGVEMEIHTEWDLRRAVSYADQVAGRHEIVSIFPKT